MAEHHTQGRQGQGARRRRNNNQGRNKRHRMPRPAEDMPRKQPSLVERVLRFFGFCKKEDSASKSRNKNNNRPQQENRPPRKTRIAKGRHNEGGNPAARSERRRATSTPPTRNARLYVGNLSYEATESELEDLFKGFGHVRSVEIIYNPRTYKSKGYAFVEMCHLRDAQQAAEVLHGQPFMGRELMVSAASERPDKAEADTSTDSPAEAPAAEAPEQAEAPTGEQA